MEIHILAAQAKVFKWVGLLYIIVGLYFGKDPINAAWQSAVAASVSMVLTGALLRVGMASLSHAMADEIAKEAEEAGETVAA